MVTTATSAYTVPNFDKSILFAGRSVGIVRSRTLATEFMFVVCALFAGWFPHLCVRVCVCVCACVHARALSGLR
jgi:hypothetical protein